MLESDMSCDHRVNPDVCRPCLSTAALMLCVMTIAAIGSAPVVAQSPDTTAVPDTAAGETEKADSASLLAKHELRAVGSKVIVSAERDLSKQLSSARSLYRKAVKAMVPVQTIQRNIAVLEGKMYQATQQLVVYNAQLANVQSVAANNRLVGLLNSLEGQMQLAQTQIEQLKKQENEARAEMNKAREAYVQHVIEMRELADEVDEVYSIDPADPALQAKLQELEKDKGEKLTFEATSSFRNSMKKLVDLENSIHSESIQLRREGDTFWASVVIDGEHTVEMVVDSGASLISIPFEMAKTLKMEPTARDEEILLTLADGSEIVGYLKTIKAVRVGQFTVENVKCAVLGPEAVEALPLLGMSFLGEFQFQLNASEATLGMTRVEDSSSRSRR
jgi:aspartyl protease family protein